MHTVAGLVIVGVMLIGAQVGAIGVWDSVCVLAVFKNVRYGFAIVLVRVLSCGMMPPSFKHMMHMMPFHATPAFTAICCLINYLMHLIFTPNATASRSLMCIN